MRHFTLFVLIAALLAVPAVAQSLTQATSDNLDDVWPSISDDGNHIVWVKDVRGKSDVYVMDAWNLTPKKLTTLGTITFPGGAAVSGDGKNLAIIAGRNVFLVPTAGGTPTQLTAFTGNQSAFRDVCLSRDGTKVGFTIKDSTKNTYNFAVVDTKTSSLSVLTNNAPADYLYGTMSADGSLVAFTAKGSYSDHHLWFVGTDGKNLRRASTLKVRAYTYPSLDRNATRCAVDGVDWEVYTIRTDGSQLVNVSQNSSSKDAGVRLSGDGDRVVWKSQRTQTYGDVFMAYPDGSGLRRAIAINGLPPATAMAALTVNGDGSIVVYASNYPTGFRNLWVWKDGLTRSAASAPKPGNTVALILQDSNAAGGSYLIRSAFSRAPGIVLPGVGTVPLAPDSLFWASGATPTVFQNYSGTFNTKGQAGAFIQLPSAPQLIGVSFYTCAVGVLGSKVKIFNPILMTIE